MALFRSHDDKVLWSLTKAIRLLLPELGEQYRQKAGYVLGGLAARFGGLWAPHPQEVTQPLRALTSSASAYATPPTWLSAHYRRLCARIRRNVGDPASVTGSAPPGR